MSQTQMETMLARLDLQNAEFNALTKLAEQWRKLQQVAVVDDYYPEARHYYESALKSFLEVCEANGRIKR